MYMAISVMSLNLEQLPNMCMKQEGIFMAKLNILNISMYVQKH